MLLGPLGEEKVAFAFSYPRSDAASCVRGIKIEGTGPVIDAMAESESLENVQIFAGSTSEHELTISAPLPFLSPMIRYIRLQPTTLCCSNR